MLPRLTTDTLLVVLFVVVISGPVVGLVLSPGSFRADARAEAVARCPGRPGSLAELGAWPGAAVRCFSERFAFRRGLIRLNALLRVRLLGVSTTPRVIVGRDRWLFYADENSVEDFRRTDPFTEDQLDAWRRTLRGWGRLLAARNIPFIVLIAPNKPTIYPELVPRWMTRVNDQSRADQLFGALANEPAVDTVDVRLALTAARRTGLPVYLRTDTHWNRLGAFVGYRELASALARHFPQVPIPPGPDAIEAKLAPVRTGGDLARMLGLEDNLGEDQDVAVDLPATSPAESVNESATIPAPPDEERPRQVTVRPGAPIDRAVIFRDSFSDWMLPWLAEPFGRAVYVASPHVKLDVLERERPNVVILQLVERRLMHVTPAPPPWSMVPSGP